MVITLRIDDPKTWNVDRALGRALSSRPDLFDISRAGKHCDVVLKSTSTLLQSPGRSEDYYGAPVILFDSYDVTWLSPPIVKEAAKPEVKAYVRSNTFRDPISYYRNTWRGTYYGHVLKSSFAHLPPNPVPRNTDDYLEAAIKKIVLLAPVIPSLPSDALEMIEDAYLPIHSRSIDFLVNTWNANQTQLSILEKDSTHITDFTTDSLFDKDKARGIEYLTYLAGLCDTKVFISPWGASAWSRADMEALLCGCILIKPECSNTKTLPDIYSPSKGWIQFCAPDFSDLHHVAEYVASNYLDFAYAAEEAQKFLLSYFKGAGKPSVFAEDIYSLCKHVIAGTEGQFKDITKKIPLGQ